MYSPQEVHFILNGAMRRTVINFGPVGRRCLGVRVILEGSKSGGKYFVRTFRSDIVAVRYECGSTDGCSKCWRGLKYEMCCLKKWEKKEEGALSDGRQSRDCRLCLSQSESGICGDFRPRFPTQSAAALFVSFTNTLEMNLPFGRQDR